MAAMTTVMSDVPKNEKPAREAQPNAAAAAGKSLSPEARRALAEAEARRAEIDRLSAAKKSERGGRAGLEPVRYGDWEIKGLTSDF